MKHSASAPAFGGYAFAPASTLFIPPQEDAAQPYEEPASLSGATFGAAVWWESGVVAHLHAGLCVTDVQLDTHQDLVWSCTADGHVGALSFPDLQRHCAYSAFSGRDVRALIAGENAVVSVAANEVRVHSRTGVLRSSFPAADRGLGELFCAAQVQEGLLALGGAASTLSLFDVEHNRVTLQGGSKSGCSAVKIYKGACYTALVDGSVGILDPRTLRSQNTLFTGFPGGLQALDVKDKLLCCSGYALGRGGSTFLDGVVKVFDLRMMRALAPIPFAPGAYKLKFHPVFSATVILMAQSGQLQVSDVLGAHASLQGYHVDAGGGLLYGLDVSSTGECFYVSDSAGFLHQWVDREQPRLNIYSKPLEEPVRPTPFKPVMPDSERVPLSMLDAGVWAIKAPSSFKNLSSTWPADLWFNQPIPFPPIPQVYLQSMQPARDGDFIMYSHVPRNPGFLRYQYPLPVTESVRTMEMSLVEAIDIRKSLEAFNSPAKFPESVASLLAASGEGRNLAGGDGAAAGPVAGSAPSSAPVLKPPAMYQQKTVTYSRIGVAGFDFEFYNRTPFSGLENVMQYSYVNGALQLLYFQVPIRTALMGHLCSREFCLSCELGFLFRMLERAGGQVCQAHNLLRALEHMPAAREAGLVGWKDEQLLEKRLGVSLLEKFFLFAVDQMKLESSTPGTLPFANALTCRRRVALKCRRCGNQDSKEEESSLDYVQLKYPEDTSVQQSFGAILRSSIMHKCCGTLPDREDWCGRCGNKQPSTVTVAPASLPSVFYVLSGLGESEKYFASWKTASSGGGSNSGGGGGNRRSAGPSSSSPLSLIGAFDAAADGVDDLSSQMNSNNDDSRSEIGARTTWLPTSVKVTFDATGGIQVEELAGVAASAADGSGTVYTLTAVLSNVHDPRKFPGPGHSVLHQKIGPSHTADKALRSWYLFNDFEISRTSAKEALSFDTYYKNACVLVWSRNDDYWSSNALAASLSTPSIPIPWTVFQVPPISSTTKDGQPRVIDSKAHPVASEDDLPKPGEFLPIDTEFVCTAPELTKTLASGMTVVVRPMQYSLGRVSVLREDGRVLIDDYIHACDPVHDYLTQYSGLAAGDLDPEVSRHSVAKLKTCYQKLLYLVERGCSFVGHGLAKDFNIVNIFVPLTQVRDTVDLFHLPRSRKISLRWLVSYLLGHEIQIDTHDSIEDARSAMAIFRKYEQMVTAGDFDTQLQELYETGRNNNWESRLELKRLEEELLKTLDLSQSNDADGK